MKTRITSLVSFVKRLLEDNTYGVCTESTDLEHPSLKHSDAGVQLASDGERLLIGKVTYHYVFNPTLWFLLPFSFRKEPYTLTFVAIASKKNEYAKIEWLDECFSESCAILLENLDRSFYLYKCHTFSDRVRFSRSYIWDSIKRQWTSAQ